VLNVTNTSDGPTAPQQTYPTASFFATVPSAIVGTATGTGVTSGVTGEATGTSGVGVVAYTTTAIDPALVAFNGVTGYTEPSDGNPPQAIFAEMANGGGGTVISAAATASTAPACASGTHCQETRIIDAQGEATSGQITAFHASLDSPSATGLALKFGVAPTSGNFISAGVDCSGTSTCPYFQVDGSGDVSASGTLFVQGSAQANKGLTVSNGPLTVNDGMVFNGNISSEFGGPIYVDGNLNVSGSISKGSGSFKIDHPLDPANKYLYHSFVESPDMMNIYNGVVVLDKHGKAVVTLPDYFEALNQDFRYQLTAIGAPGPKLYIAGEISGNKFSIAGGKAGAKVSWQVTGIRHDAYAEAHRIVVEEAKPEQERGTYLHPELFNSPQVIAEKK
jgi:cytoskeletal protein CcmA (bactofilin family)